MKVAEYSNEEKKRSTRIVLIFFVLGIIALILNIAIKFMELQENFFVGFLEGSTISLAIGAMVLGILYATGILCKVFAFKRRLLGKEDMYGVYWRICRERRIYFRTMAIIRVIDG